MAKRDKKTPKGKKATSVSDLPPKAKGGEAVKGGYKVTFEDLLVSQVTSPKDPHSGRT